MTIPWHDVEKIDPLALSEARLQLHYAIQFLAAPAAALAVPLADLGHTSLSWETIQGSPVFVSQPMPAEMPLRVALHPLTLTVLLLSNTGDPFASYPLAGQTMTAGLEWLKTHLAERGAEAEKVAWLSYPADFPPHALGEGSPFADPEGLPLAALVAYYAKTAPLLQTIALPRRGASPLRIWPHHFDMAVLIQPQPQQFIGVGLSPGDHYYAQPYWYVSAYPYPQPEPFPPLPEPAFWHTQDWLGAVLTGSALKGRDPQIELPTFLETAISMSEGWFQP
ncbi:MAG: hypothetical protein NW237_01975 [Cyanobacteriota bacterium]|nr:hypothetical protein [Cyanobacteriota bacterium]